MKECRICHEIKCFHQFHRAKSCLDGFRGECKKCQGKMALERAHTPEGIAKRASDYQKNKEKWNERRRSIEGRKRYRGRVERTPSYVLSFALYRALKRRPTEIAVTHAELMQIYEDQKGLCALSSIQMTWMNGKIRPTSISIDRIDSTKGYTLDNVRLICHAVNRMKGDATDAEVLEIAEALVTNMRKPKLRLVS